MSSAYPPKRQVGGPLTETDVREERHTETRARPDTQEAPGGPEERRDIRARRAGGQGGQK